MKQLARRMYAASNSGDLEEADSIFTADFHSHPLDATGADAITQTWTARRRP